MPRILRHSTKDFLIGYKCQDMSDSALLAINAEKGKSNDNLLSRFHFSRLLGAT